MDYQSHLTEIAANTQEFRGFIATATDTQIAALVRKIHEKENAFKAARVRHLAHANHKRRRSTVWQHELQRLDALIDEGTEMLAYIQSKRGL